MNEDRPWLGEEPTGRPDLRWPPVATGVGVFFGVAGLIAFAGIAIGVQSTDGKPLVSVMIVGVVIGVICGVLVTLRLLAREGGPPRRQL